MNDASRRFCGDCGLRLVEPCLDCQSDNGLWERYCGRCGSNLRELLIRREHLLTGMRQTAESLCTQFRLSQASALLEQVAGNDHWELREYAAWANRRLPDVRGQLEHWRAEQERRTEEARQLMFRCKYNAVLELLQGIPEALRSVECQRLIDAATMFWDERQRGSCSMPPQQPSDSDIVSPTDKAPPTLFEPVRRPLARNNSLSDIRVKSSFPQEPAETDWRLHAITALAVLLASAAIAFWQFAL